MRVELSFWQMVGLGAGAWAVWRAMAAHDARVPLSVAFKYPTVPVTQLLTGVPVPLPPADRRSVQVTSAPVVGITKLAQPYRATDGAGSSFWNLAQPYRALTPESQPLSLSDVMQRLG